MKLRRSVRVWIIVMLAIMAGNIGVFRFAYVSGAATAFTAGDVLVYRVGDGRGLLAGTGNPVFLDEYAPSGALVRSLPMPTVASGANHRFVASGTALAEGFLTRSADGQYVVLTGYDAAVPTPNLAGTSSSTVARVVGRVDVYGAIDTTTALIDFADAGKPHGVASPNGIDFWVGGADSGVRYTVLGSTTSTQVNSTVANIRAIGIFGGRLYVSYSSDSAARIATVGSGLPILSGRTITNAPGFPSGEGSPCGFFLADLNPFVAGPDTLYVADERMGITKYSLVKGRWVVKGTAGLAGEKYRGLTGVVDGTAATLYATRNGGGESNGGGELVTLHDATGYNGVLAATPSIMATAAAGTAFRGVALAPGVTALSAVR